MGRVVLARLQEVTHFNEFHLVLNIVSARVTSFVDLGRLSRDVQLLLESGHLVFELHAPPLLRA